MAANAVMMAVPVVALDPAGQRSATLILGLIDPPSGNRTSHWHLAGGYDVTEKVRAKAELERTNLDLAQRVAEESKARSNMEAALFQLQKMEAVGQFTGGLAHDFNNLLMGISGSLEVFRMRQAQGRIDEMERFITAAMGGTRRAAALTHRLLAFSRRQTLDPTTTDVNRLVLGMEESIRRTMGPAIELERFASGGLWTIKVDQGRPRQT